MPLQINNFAGIPHNKADHSGISNALTNYLKGAHSPQMAAEEQRKMELANALSEVEARYADPFAQQKLTHGDLVNQYYGPEKEAHIKQMEASAKHTASGGGLQGHARNVADLVKLLNDPNIPNEQKELAKALFAAELAKSQSIVDTRNQNIQFKPYNSLSADEKADLHGKYRALGIGQSDAQELYTHKVTPEKIHAFRQANPQASNHDAVSAIVAESQGQQGQQQQGGNIPGAQFGGQQEQGQGIPGVPGQEATMLPPEIIAEQQQQQEMQAPQLPPTITPVDTRTIPNQPAMTSGNRKDFNDINGALAEDSFLEPYVTEGMKKYSRKLFGYSPQLIKDAASKDPKVKEDVSWALAIRAINPEISGYRSRLAGGSNAHQALHDITTNSLNGLNAFEFQLDPETYALTQEKISFLINGMGEARKNGISGQINPKDLQKHLKKEAPMLKVIGITPDGRRVNVPADKMEEFIKKGGKRSE